MDNKDYISTFQSVLKLGVLLIYIFVATPAAANSFFKQFIDPKDGKIDLSQWLSGRTGFLPIPIIISDPAVGYGGGAALAFFHESKEDKQAEADPNDMLSLPPSVSFLVGAATENGSWVTAGGHFGSYRQDKIRYTGALGYGSLNLRFYGIDTESQLEDNGLEFNLQGFLLFQQLTFRIKESNFFIGGRYSYFNSRTDFNIFGDIPIIPDDEIDDATAGLGLIINYDSRDNIISPNKGQLAKLHMMFYNQAFGGDYDYTKIKATSISYWPVLKSVVLGIRLEGDFSGGDIPFYDVPYINMRGIPALRYQGDNVIVTEVEARWDITYRWSLLGFGGSGWTADHIGDFGEDSAKFAGGAGFRYLIARRFGLRVGIDIAVGPEDTVLYMGVGSAW